METVLVTGGTGYIARWCMVQLLERGYDVRTTVRDRAREPDIRAAIGEVVDAGDRLAVVEADLLDDHGWSAAVEGCRYVLHPASPLGGGSDESLIATRARRRASGAASRGRHGSRAGGADVGRERGEPDVVPRAWRH